MLGLVGFLYLILLGAFIVGMIKPSIILRWMKNPTRLKVFGIYILSTFIVGVIFTKDTEEVKPKLIDNTIVWDSLQTTQKQEYLKAFIDGTEPYNKIHFRYGQAISTAITQGIKFPETLTLFL